MLVVVVGEVRGEGREGGGRGELHSAGSVGHTGTCIYSFANKHFGQQDVLIQR